MSGAPITPEFEAKAPPIMAAIIEALSKYRVSDEDAAAILGSFGVETGGFTLRQEVGKPNKDSTGYGWAQWTGMDPGERRLLFEQWCDANGFGDVVDDPDGVSDEVYDNACFGYFIHEISNTWEERVLTIGGEIGGVFYPPLCQCSTLDQKTESFWRLYERPGTPHEEWRREMAHEALRLYRGEWIIEQEEKPMAKQRIALSSGHSAKCRGASGILDEVDEARRVVARLAEELRARGVEVETFNDDVSTTQNENLNRIVDWHNARERDLDISVHLNAYVETTKPMGCEVLYMSEDQLADDLSAAIASCGFIDRGGKYRDDLFFLNSTSAPAVLLEICFVDSTADANIYGAEFEAICAAMADVLGGQLHEEEGITEPPPVTAGRPPRVLWPDRPVRIGRVEIEVSGPVTVIINRVPRAVE